MIPILTHLTAAAFAALVAVWFENRRLTRIHSEDEKEAGKQLRQAWDNVERAEAQRDTAKAKATALSRERDSNHAKETEAEDRITVLETAIAHAKNALEDADLEEQEPF